MVVGKGGGTILYMCVSFIPVPLQENQIIH